MLQITIKNIRIHIRNIIVYSFLIVLFAFFDESYKVGSEAAPFFVTKCRVEDRDCKWISTLF